MLPLFQTAGISPSVLHREGMAAVFTLSVAAVPFNVRERTVGLEVTSLLIDRLWFLPIWQKRTIFCQGL